MADTPKVYVICDQNCKFEGMTREQILTAITQAVNEGTIGNIDTGFITTIKTINGLPLKFFVGSQSEYEALTAEEKNGLYAIITNDSTRENMEELLETVSKSLTELIEGLGTGNVVVGKAKEAQRSNTLKNNWNSAEIIIGSKSIKSGLPIGDFTLEVAKTYLVEITTVDGNSCTFIISVKDGNGDLSNTVLLNIGGLRKFVYLATGNTGEVFIYVYGFDGAEYTSAFSITSIYYKELIGLE